MIYFPRKMKSIFGSSVPLPPSLDGIKNFAKSQLIIIVIVRAYSIGNSNRVQHSNSNSQYTLVSLFHPAPSKNNLKAFA